MDECAAETLEGVDHSRSHMLVRYLSHGIGTSINGLTLLILVKYLHPSRYPRLSTSKRATRKASSSASSRARPSARHCNVQQLWG